MQLAVSCIDILYGTAVLYPVLGQPLGQDDFPAKFRHYVLNYEAI